MGFHEYPSVTARAFQEEPMIRFGMDAGLESDRVLPRQWLERACVLLAFVLLFACRPLQAQTANGQILGTVTDAQGAAIPQAQVTVTNVGTGVAWNAVTDSHGAYHVNDLPIGNYSVTVTFPGFTKTVTGAESLNINQSLLINVQMNVGAVTQSVEVSANAAQVETQVPTVGGTVTGAPIQSLPLNGRNTLSLALTQPGVVPTPENGQSQAVSFSIAGGRADSVLYLMDGGINNNVTGGTVVFNPNPDTVAEFRILENNYTAEYGHSAGGVVSVVTKSGTNQWHGSAFDYLRNTDLDANLFFNKEQPALGNPFLPRPILNRNQFGGTFGGPVLKNRLFFFFGYQGQRQTATQSGQLITVYTPAELTGDFSGADPTDQAAVANFLTSYPYYQPNHALALQGIIDPTKIDPVAQAYIAAGLIPSTATGTLQPTGNPTDNANQYTGRLDFYPSTKDRLSATVGYNKETTSSPLTFTGPSYDNGSADVPGFGSSSPVTNDSFNLAWTRTISPTTLNEARFVVERYYSTSTPTSHPPSGSTLGVVINSDDYFGPPQLSFDDSGLQIGFNPNVPRLKADTTFAYSDMFSWVHGNHTLKFGASWTAVRERSTYTYQTNGAFEFGGSETGIGSGDDLADFLLGVPDYFYEYSKGVNGEQQKQTTAFAEDTWQVRPHLTLTFGLRYEYYSPETDPAGASFDFIKGLQSQRFSNAPPGLVVPGDPGAPKGWYFPDYLDWAPRFGFAWDPTGDGKTSLRGGAGVFYDSLNGWMADWNDDVQPFWPGAYLFYDTTNIPSSGPATIMEDPYGNAGITDPFPTTPPPVNLDFAGLGYLPFGYGVFFVNPHLRTPYIYQYNLSLQRQVARNLMAEIGYVGSSTHHEITWADENPIDPASIVCSGGSCSGQRVLNEELGISPAEVANGTNGYAPLTYFDGLVHGSYNALVASLTLQSEKVPHFGSTFFTMSYTWSHNLDNGSEWNSPNPTASIYFPSASPNALYGNSDINLAQRFVLSGGWTLPFDEWWSNGPKRLTGGWTLYPILEVQTGSPIDMSIYGSSLPQSSPGPSGYGDRNAVRPDVLTSGYQTFNPRQIQTLTSGTGNTITGNFFFNPGAFAPDPCIAANTCPVGFYGTYRRNSLMGPGLTNLDLALEKTFPLFENVHLAFRAEAFNLFNHAEFENPGSTRVTSGTFGVISQTLQPRILQGALRLDF
jgi:Carboxypeptidase regulatory-like domain